jgi:hypothetical protein
MTTTPEANWIVIGQENHPDRFINDSVYGPYTEAEAEEKLAWLEAYDRRDGNRATWNWRVMEMEK